MDENNIYVGDIGSETSAEGADMELDGGFAGWDEHEAGSETGDEGDPADGTDAPEGEAEADDGEGGDGAEEHPGPEDKAAAGEQFSLTWNGRETQVGRDELIALAQKGMNYDHVAGELDSRRQEAERYGPALQMVERYASAAGMSVDEYARYLERNTLDAEVRRLVETEGLPPEHAREMAELRRQAEAGKRAAEEARQAGDAARRQADVNAELGRLVARYPQVAAARELPREVYGLVAQGMDVVSAYEHYQLKQEVAALKQQQAAKTKAKEVDDKNRRALPGSAKGLGDGGGEGDAFLKGFMGG